MAPKLAISALLLLLVIIQALFVKSEPQISKSLQLLEGARKGYTFEGLNQVKQYLKAFGYYSINGSSHTDSFDDVLESALKSYQVPTILSSQDNDVKFSMIANYSFFNGMPRWNKRQLTYMFRSSAFVIKANPSDIVMGFHRRSHGDNFPFDGPGNVLAHAFAPRDGRLHYDADENWSTSNAIRQNQIDLESVAIHEIGHILGLGHSEDPNAIMYAYFSPGTIKRNLGRDDIDGIRALYSN
ncbi:hypothetical protein Goklo_019744 [Gossypium klotzschianum]|uniref:Peptidase metallopeptidase domain-containing protein n=1 Tax=Gossypium klotzschianum TaxID=34286 RepID=A0A7J8UPQ9_9ROSI|nr:hypothetical protein [Gossypium klotzschianum]